MTMTVEQRSTTAGPRSWLRRAGVAAVAVSCVVVALVAGSESFGQSREQSRPDPGANNIVPPSPYRPTGTEIVVPRGQPVPFPVSLEDQPGVRRRSAGPYVTQDRVIRRVLDHLACGKEGTSNVCTSVVVQFYSRYEDAWRNHSASWGFVSAFARDREVYFVTVRGDIDLATTARTLNANAEKRADHWNYQVDATTGEILGSGTAGVPLIGEEITVTSEILRGPL